MGGSGYSEFQSYIEAGKMRPIAVTSPQRLKGLNIPTVKEQGIDIEWATGAVSHAAAGISEAQRQALTDKVLQATKSKSWQEALEKNSWTPALLTGKAFEDFVDRDFASLRAIMVKSGMV